MTNFSSFILINSLLQRTQYTSSDLVIFKKSDVMKIKACDE